MIMNREFAPLLLQLYLSSDFTLIVFLLIYQSISLHFFSDYLSLHIVHIYIYTVVKTNQGDGRGLSFR